MTTKEIIGLALAIGVLTIDLVTDYRLWLKYRNQVKPEGSVKHTYGALIRMAGLAAPIVLTFPWLASAIIFGYWIFFDGIFNLLTGENWFRIGTTSTIDKFQLKYPWARWIKYIGFILSVLLFFVIK